MQRVAIGLLLVILANSVYAAPGGIEVSLPGILGLLGIGLAALGLVRRKSS